MAENKSSGAKKIARCPIVYSVAHDLRTGNIAVTLYGRGGASTINLAPPMARQLARLLTRVAKPK